MNIFVTVFVNISKYKKRLLKDSATDLFLLKIIWKHIQSLQYYIQ